MSVHRNKGREITEITPGLCVSQNNGSTLFPEEIQCIVQQNNDTHKQSNSYSQQYQT